MIKALCASLLLSATSSLGAVDLPDYYTPSVSDVDLSVVIHGDTFQRVYYNENAYLEFNFEQTANFLFEFGPDHYFSVQDGSTPFFASVGLILDYFYGSFNNDWNVIYFLTNNGTFSVDEVDLLDGFCCSFWYYSPVNHVYIYNECYRSSDVLTAQCFTVDASGSSLVVDDFFGGTFDRNITKGDSLHFEPLPVNIYDFLVSQTTYDAHPLLSRTQPKLPPEAVTNQDFNLWNTVRDFYVRFLFGGTDSQGVVYNKASFGSVSTSSFNVGVGENSVSMGDWLSSTLTIVTFALFLLVIVFVVRWIAVSIGSAVLGVSGR